MLTMSTRSSTPENDVFSLEIIPERENKKPGVTETDFDGLLHRPLLLHEDLKDGCGGQLWPAGMTLSKYMLSHHRDLKGKTVLEIGAGGGLAGLAVAAGCQLSDNHKIILTDQLPMLSLMRRNISLNSLESKAQAEIFDWGDSIPLVVQQGLTKSSQEHRYADIVLAADCVYFEPAFPLLLQTLKDIIGPSTSCYFCFKKRRKADMRFIRDLNKTFDVIDVDYEDKEIDRRNTIFLYEVRKRATES